MHKCLLLCVFIFWQINMLAQVTIGSSKTPEPYSTLEIDSSTGGLRYPQMTTSIRDVIALTDSKAHGLMIFNTSDKVLEYYTENQTWVNLSANKADDGQTGLATIQDNGTETVGSTLSYKFTFTPSPSAIGAKNLRVGSYLDANNLVLNVTGDISGDIASPSSIQVDLSLDRIAELTAKELKSKLTFYAIFEEKGHDRRIEFSIELP